MRRLVFFVGAAVLTVAPAFSATLNVDQNDGGCNDVTGTPYCTIGAASDDAVDLDEVVVAPGTYVENVIVDEDITLRSTGGRGVTTIEGISNVGALGTVQVEGNTTGVVIGGVGQGFTINGIDNGAPGVENAAVYLRGSHLSASVIDNEVVARGDSGLTSEYGATMTLFTVTLNEFSGRPISAPSPATAASEASSSHRTCRASS